jgi:hypothetical protein
VVAAIWQNGDYWCALWWLLTGRTERGNWQNSCYCVAVWSVIYPHFLPFFLPQCVGHARVVQHRIKSENGFDSVIVLFSGFWIKIIRKIIFSWSATTFFFIEKSWQKRTCAIRSEKRLKNSGTRYAPKFLVRFVWMETNRNNFSKSNSI